MRKTCLFWSPKEITLLENQQQRLKTLQALYPQLIILDHAPTQFNHRQNYIRIANYQSQYVFPISLLTTIIYCLKLDSNKKRQIQRNYENVTKSMKKTNPPSLNITNDFGELIKIVIKQLGYEQQISSSKKQIIQQETSAERQQNRFAKDKQQKHNIKQNGQTVQKQQFYKQHNVRQAYKSFKLDFKDIEKMQIKVLASELQKQLRSYLMSKGIQPIERQFNKFKQSKTLIQLCRHCLYFYTLQKYTLYQDLNMILRNIRSIVFKQQFQRLKLFAFLLIINYLFAYTSDFNPLQNNVPQVLYRYTDVEIDPELSGKIVTIPSFYSVSALQQISNFNKKQTKIIIHPLVQGNSSISLNSLYPIYKFSAFRKQRQFLYLPFTCFLITQIRYKKSQQKWIVHMKQVPGNSIVQKILDINLLNVNETNKIINKKETFTAQWQLKCQQRYQFSNDKHIKIRASYNLGLVFMRLLQKYQLATNYFNQGIQLIKEIVRNNPNLTTKISMSYLLVKGYNYIGLTYIKLQNLQKADQALTTAEKQFQILTKLHSQNMKKQKSQNIQTESDQLKYLNAGMKNNRANWLQAKQNAEQAVIKYKQALKILQKCQIKHQLMQACLYNNMGVCLNNAYPQKRQQFQYLYKAFTKYLNIYGINVSNVEESPTKAKQEQKIQYQKQLRNLTKLIIQRNLKISQIISILENCSQIYTKNSKFEQALFYQQSAIDLYVKLSLVQETQSSSLMFMKAKLAKLLQREQKYKQSIEKYEQLIPLAAKFDANGVKSAVFKCNIAACYVNMGSDEDLRNAVSWYTSGIKDISQPLLNQNLQLYNKLCDYREQIQKYLVLIDKDSKK